MPEEIQWKILFDEPTAALKALYDGYGVLLVDRQDGRIPQTRLIPLTLAQALDFADWVKAVVPANHGKGNKYV